MIRHSVAAAFLMRDGFIEGETEVIENARRCAKRLLTAARG